ncbi:four-carbon acid sugar kinase family protein [Peribacillus saganii]|uniref:Four-carbon acid sugar kinase family protein n=1 Tax=Peribacillus saganii TaxID=2303992 RepID=A0A372LPR8_9BACI|nr:four-carbon acid sugar kinase family protein [Peribacillus saganii]RFU70119.1 four-carbon acid sugar kinase family protein [Peribacillus saganii]
MNKVLIIADDLTGANDTGVQFAKQGFHTLSLIELQENIYRHEADVIVFNAETRAMDAEKAFQKMKAVAETLAISDFPVVYKKIDSTMRGNIGAEIDALLDTGIFDAAVVLPAYPKNGRVTAGGYHIVHECLLEDTETARDPKCPVGESHLPTLLASQSRRVIGHIDIRMIRKRQIVNEMRKCLNRNAEIVVFDSFLQEDLKSVTAAVKESGLKVLWVGSAGMAESLSDSMEQPVEQEQSRRLPAGPEGNPSVFIIAGSVSAATRRQISALTEQSDCRLIVANPLFLLDDSRREQEMAQLLGAIVEIAANGHSPVLTTDVSSQVIEDLHSFQEKTGKGSMEIGNTIAECLGKVSAAVISSQDFAGLILTGGDIAYSTCKHLGVTALRIIDEVEEGIPLSEIVGGRLNGLPLVTKAGGFGDADSLVNAMNKINRLIRGSI